MVKKSTEGGRWTTDRHSNESTEVVGPQTKPGSEVVGFWRRAWQIERAARNGSGESASSNRLSTQDSPLKLKVRRRRSSFSTRIHAPPPSSSFYLKKTTLSLLIYNIIFIKMNIFILSTRQNLQFTICHGFCYLNFTADPQDKPNLIDTVVIF